MAGNASVFPCPAPFLNELAFPATGGFIDGRLCQLFGPLSCCLPCPMTDWAYPDGFKSSSQVANWINVVGAVCCVFLLASWSFLAAEKTHRHYLSISLTCALGFIIPFAGKPEQCFNEITPHGMNSSSLCTASGVFLIGGGWAGVMWVFLRTLSLHLQICWQIVVGRGFMWLSQLLGWGIPIIGLVIALTVSGVSFRFGQTCHVNHRNSLAAFWVPLLVFAGVTVIMQFATFGYCIKVYLALLASNSATTERSELPPYSASVRTMSPRQAYHRIRRVIQLQWRGIAIVLIIICDVIFFAVVFVFQDNVVQSAKTSDKARPWVGCLAMEKMDKKNRCLQYAEDLVVPLRTVVAVLVLLAMNGIWLLCLLGRWSMVTGWVEVFGIGMPTGVRAVSASVEPCMDSRDHRGHELLSCDSSKEEGESGLTPVNPTSSGRHTPGYLDEQPCDTKRTRDHVSR
ncbi:g-protein coupled receptor [Apiospora phragmitis]|uniref:G-protein coupled receptor n=1 Tax=Apiospora phragmitis TaxID=2905665 RepID=A0ABR1SR17_9PEZI